VSGWVVDLALKFDVAKRTYEEADDVLGFALSKLCFEGPEDELTLTKHTQPAILTTSIAVFRALQEKGLSSTSSPVTRSASGARSSPRAAMQLRDAVRLTHLRGNVHAGSGAGRAGRDGGR